MKAKYLIFTSLLLSCASAGQSVYHGPLLLPTLKETVVSEADARPPSEYWNTDVIKRVDIINPRDTTIIVTLTCTGWQPHMRVTAPAHTVQQMMVEVNELDKYDDACTLEGWK